MKSSANTVAARSAGRGMQPKSARKSSMRQKTNERATARKVRSTATAPASIPATPVLGQSKKAEVIALLRRPEGAEVVAATGWQPHTVRGLFSGTLKKKLGLTLSSAQEQRGRVYRIIGTSGAGGAAEHSGGLRLSAADAGSDG